ncbi:MAG: glycosyltransferase [Kiritimatiellales bacterium]|nr:glycosyltransferase [Kiritimatiellales bacterium]
MLRYKVMIKKDNQSAQTIKNSLSVLHGECLFTSENQTRQLEDKIASSEAKLQQEITKNKLYEARLQELEAKRKNHEERIQEQEAKLAETKQDLIQVISTRSWQWTKCLRAAEAWIRRKKNIPDTQPPHSPQSKSTIDVAVIITSHNYGKFLVNAIDSILRQSCKPAEILVMDDASTDNTSDIVQRYINHGIRYVRCKHLHPSPTRNEGASLTRAPFLVFLDADDILQEDFLEKCYAQMKDPSVAITYGDMQYFGLENHLFKAPEFDRERLMRTNYMSSHSMIRRQAFDITGGYRRYSFPAEDWDLYRRILQYKWTAKKAQTKVLYRIHGTNRLPKCKDDEYWKIINLLQNPITIFTPFAGRHDVFERYIEGLKNIEFDHKLIRLHWLDTSGDEKFGRMLRETMSTLDFGRTTYTCSPLPSIWNHTPQTLIENRFSDPKAGQYYDMALAYAYNHLLHTCDTEFALTVEDDIVLKPDTITRLLKTVQHHDVTAVIAPYPCQIQGYQTVWIQDKNNNPQFITKAQKGIWEVGGGGFGCTLIRMDVFKHTPIYSNVHLQKNPQWYDHVAFALLRRKGKVLCNWDASVEHLETDRHIPAGYTTKT